MMPFFTPRHWAKCQGKNLSPEGGGGAGNPRAGRCWRRQEDLSLLSRGLGLLGTWPAEVQREEL